MRNPFKEYQARKRLRTLRKSWAEREASTEYIEYMKAQAARKVEWHGKLEERIVEVGAGHCELEVGEGAGIVIPTRTLVRLLMIAEGTSPKVVTQVNNH